MTTISFTPAIKKTKRLKVGILGAAGSGKTYTALLMAQEIAKATGQDRFAVLDTERGSASLYAGIFQFDKMDADPPFTPVVVVDAIEAAELAGYTVLVLDSLSHFWAGTGGVLDIVENAVGDFGGNKQRAWSKGTPKQNAMVDAIMGARIHIVATMRAKPTYVEERTAQGKTRYVKVGVEPVQRSGIDHEFDLMLSLDDRHMANLDKGRFPELDNEEIGVIGPDFVVKVMALLDGEKDPDLRSRADLEAELSETDELEIWAERAWALYSWLPVGFESAKRLYDFSSYVTGGAFVLPDGWTHALRQAAATYCNGIAEDIKFSEAASLAKKKYLETLEAMALADEQE